MCRTPALLRAVFTLRCKPSLPQRTTPPLTEPQRTEPLDENFAELPADEFGPDELLIRAEQQEEFMKTLNRLPEIHRSALLLHFLEDISLDEIARITGVSVGTVKSRLHYAKKSLRTLLAERTT